MQELKIVSDKRNELLGRKELKAVFTKEGATPSRADVLKELAKSLNAKEENIAVSHIYQKYGKLQSEVIASVYDKEAPKKKSKKGEAKPEEKQQQTAAPVGSTQVAEGAVPAAEKKEEKK